MSFMSKISNLIGLMESTPVEGLHLTLRIRRGQRHTRLANVTENRPWFSIVEEKRFRRQQLERRSEIESVIRLSMAR